MAFHDVRLPEDVERGAAGGPEFKTTIQQLNSARENRNIDWSRARHSWDIGYGIGDTTVFGVVRRFFYSRRGRGHSFRFKDWSDFELDRAVIATGDGSETDFQIVKKYTDAAATYSRPLTKIVASTYSVWVNNVLQTETTDYTIDLTTGIVTFLSAVTDTHDIEVECEFDVPVRFDVDKIDVTLELYNKGAIPNLPIIEVPYE